MSSQNGGGRRNPSWLAQVLACILSSAPQKVWHVVPGCVSGGFCVTLSDKARCWMHEVVALPNPASFTSLPGLARANGFSVALAVRV